MKVHIQSGRLTVGDAAVRYNQSYVGTGDFKVILAEWLTRLRGLKEPDPRVYLPFGVDDEFVEAFEVSSAGVNVDLRVIQLDNMGYVYGEESLIEAAFGASVVLHRYPECLLRCGKEELVRAITDWLRRGNIYT